MKIVLHEPETLSLRRKRCLKPKAKGNEKIHELAGVRSTQIGESIFVWPFCVILSGAKIGSNCNINCNCFIENDMIIGSNVTIKSGVYVWDGVRVEDNVFVGPCVAFTNDIFPRSKHYPVQFLQTFIGENASIGANSTILTGVKIGSYVLMGVGSMVTRDIPSSLCAMKIPQK